MSYKTTDELMEYLKSCGIEISGSRQKRQLLQMGYFHGYKGYRFFKDANHKLPFSTFEEIVATISYDAELKSLLYGHIMFLETALKNIVLEAVLHKSESEKLGDVMECAVAGYCNAPIDASHEEKRHLQKNKLKLQKMVFEYITRGYERENPIITHYCQRMNDMDLPIWAIFEIMTMGDFGYFLSCLTDMTRDDISKRIGLYRGCDTKRELPYRYVYALKDLRNAIAHNGVIFDTRFRKMDPSGAMRQCMMIEIGLPYFNFKTIGDYVILIAYFLKKLGVDEDKILKMIYAYEDATTEYRNQVSETIYHRVIHRDLVERMEILKKFI